MYVKYLKPSIYFVFNDKPLHLKYNNYGFVRDSKGEYRDLNGNRWRLVSEELMEYDGGVGVETKFLYNIFKGKDIVERNIFVDYFDIETNNTLDTVNVPEPIISITHYSDRVKKYFIVYIGEGRPIEKDNKVFLPVQNEISLFETYFELLSKVRPNFIVGWNSDKFDWPYIINRGIKILGMQKMKKILSNVSPFKKVLFPKGQKDSLDIVGINLIDLMNLFIKFIGEENSYSLDYIASKYLDFRKVKLDTTVADVWKHDKEKFFDYVIRDVELLSLLNEKFKFIELVNTLGIVTIMPLNYVTKASRRIEGLLFKKIFPRKEILPPKGTRNIVYYKGALVRGPKYLGLIDEPIFVYDFVSLYPNLIRTLNISPQTKKKDGSIKIVLPEGREVFFLEPAKKHSIFTELINELFPLRLQYKKKMKEYDPNTPEYNQYYILQYVLKIILNSFYGYMAFPYSVMFDNECAEAITTAGRQIISSVSKLVESLGKEVIYIDTDSMFIKGLTDEKEALEFLELVNKTIPKLSEKLWNANSGEYLRLALDKKITRIIFFSKKQYVFLDDSNQVHEVGTFTIKSDVPIIVQQNFKKLFRKVLTKEMEIDNELFLKWLNKCKEEFFSAPAIDIGIAKNIRKSIEYYNAKGMPFHVKGLITYLNLRRKVPPSIRGSLPFVTQGKVISYYLKPDNPLKSDSFSIPDIVKNKEIVFRIIDSYIDRTKQWEHTFLKKAQIVAQVFNLNIDSMYVKPKKDKKGGKISVKVKQKKYKSITF